MRQDRAGYEGSRCAIVEKDQVDKVTIDADLRSFDYFLVVILTCVWLDKQTNKGGFSVIKHTGNGLMTPIYGAKKSY